MRRAPSISAPLAVYALAWLPMIAIGIANGVLREVVFAGRVAELRAHQLSTVTAVVLLGAYMSLVFRHRPPDSTRQALAVGLLWLALTVGFEFLFGHYVAGHGWARLLDDYDVVAGRVWLAVPALLAIAPYLAFRWRTRP